LVFSWSTGFLHGEWFSPGPPVSSTVSGFLLVLRFPPRSVVFSWYSGFLHGRWFSPGTSSTNTLNIFYCQSIIDNGSDKSYKLTRSSPPIKLTATI
jgi:hypothetical protein